MGVAAAEQPRDREHKEEPDGSDQLAPWPLPRLESGVDTVQVHACLPAPTSSPHVRHFFQPARTVERINHVMNMPSLIISVRLRRACVHKAGTASYARLNASPRTRTGLCPLTDSDSIGAALPWPRRRGRQHQARSPRLRPLGGDHPCGHVFLPSAGTELCMLATTSAAIEHCRETGGPGSGLVGTISFTDQPLGRSMPSNRTRAARI